jgi:hypothetical protein
MKQGDILIATDPCKMNGGNTCALTIGKEYPILEITQSELRVRDNQGDYHWYSLEGPKVYTKWFIRKGIYEIY